MTRNCKIQSLIIAAESARGLNASRAAQLLLAAEAYVEGTEKRNRLVVFGAVLLIVGLIGYWQGIKKQSAR